MICICVIYLTLSCGLMHTDALVDGGSVMQSSSDEIHSACPSRRGFLAAGMSGVVATTVPVTSRADTGKEDSFELNELTITDLHLRLREEKTTSRSLVEKYLARIESIDRKGPMLNSVIE